MRIHFGKRRKPSAMAEPVLTPHVKALRELVDRGILCIVWADNRDLVTDPLTKGKTTRNELSHTMTKGEWIIREQVYIWPKEQRKPSAGCAEGQ